MLEVSLYHPPLFLPKRRKIGDATRIFCHRTAYLQVIIAVVKFAQEMILKSNLFEQNLKFGSTKGTLQFLRERYLHKYHQPVVYVIYAQTVYILHIRILKAFI